MTAHDFLATLTTFKDLPPEELTQLAVSVQRRQFGPGEAIVRQGDAATECFIIASGVVQVTRRSQSGASEEQPLATLRTGDLLGEIALIDGSTRSATATASETTQCIAIPAQALQGLLQRNHEFALALLRQAVIRLAAMEQSVQ